MSADVVAGSNPYLAAASGIMSGFAGMGQSGPSMAYGGTQSSPVNVGGLNVPARGEYEALPNKSLSANAGLLFAVGALAIWYFSKK